MLTEEQRRRYARQLIFPGFDELKQEKLLASRVLVIGAGGLGSSALLYLTASGVGTIGLADFDCVELSDLNRQIIYSMGDINRKKVDRACEKLRLLNNDVQLIPYDFKITRENISEVTKECDLVLECSDSLPTKLLVNDVCFFLNKPAIIAGIEGCDGTIIFLPKKPNACYRCLYRGIGGDEEEFHNRDIPVLGMIPGILGTMQALEAVKYLSGVGKVGQNRLFYFCGADLSLTEIPLRRNAACPLCGEQPSIGREMYIS